MPSGIGAAGSGAELTSEAVQSMLLEPLLAASRVLAAGPQRFTSSGGAPIRVPLIKEYDIGGVGPSPTAGPWVAENGLIGEADPEYDEVTLLPSTLKSLKVIHRFSNELARLAVVNIAAALQNALVRRVALAIDRAMLLGDPGGADPANTITGIVNFPDIQTLPYGGPITIDDLIDAEGMALAADASPSCWFLNPAVYTALSKQREGGATGAYLLQPDPTQAGAMRLRGLPAYSSTQLPAGTVILADMAQVAVAQDLDASVKLLSERYADYDQLALRVVSRWDIAALNPEGIVLMTP